MFHSCFEVWLDWHYTLIAWFWFCSTFNLTHSQTINDTQLIMVMSKCSPFWYDMGEPLRQPGGVLYIKKNTEYASGTVEKLVVTICLSRDK